MSLAWKVDECAAYFGGLRLRGWCFLPGATITKIEAVFPAPATVVALDSYGIPSPDVAAAFDPAATHCRFEEWIRVPEEAIGRDFALRFTLANGAVVIGESVLTNATCDDRFFLCWEHFIAALNQLPDGRVLEIGSRARSGTTQRHRIPARFDYVGLDILPGPNVDLVGDAHALEACFGRNQFVAAFSLSVFEHLAMPWKVALELNRVLVPGGLVYTSTHQTWPMHEEPWDFWRFSAYAWQTLFNPATGFEVVEAVAGEPARIHSSRTSPATRELSENPAWLGSACIARKIGETPLSWPVQLEVAARGNYPAGELATPPA